jgi:hypothetical protein
MPRRDLCATTPQRQFLERVVERQADLRGVPAARQLRGDGLAPGDLHPETIEAQCLRPIGLRMRLVAESVASLAGTAAGAESWVRRVHASDGPGAVYPATVETELLTVVNLSKCLRHVSLSLFRNHSTQGV